MSSEEIERLRERTDRAEDACRLANDAFNALLLHRTNEVPEGFFAGWSRYLDGEGLGHTAHKAVNGVVARLAAHPETREDRT